MVMYVKKRGIILFVLFSAAMIVVLLACLMKKEKQIDKYERQIAYSYQQKFSDLAETFAAVDEAMQKGLYTDSVYQSVLLASTVWYETGAAKSCLDQLPLYDLQLQQTAKFFNQAGDYALHVAKKLLRDEEISETERASMRTLSQRARIFAEQFQGIQSQIQEVNMDYDALIALMQHTSDAETQNELEELEQLDAVILQQYDGLYSDHVTDRESVFLAEKALITEANARRIAATYLGVDVSSLSFIGEIESGTVSCYVFGNDDYAVHITKQGGYLYSFMRYRDVRDATVDDENAIALASSYLEKIKFSNMELSYYHVSGNVLTAYFIYSQYNVVYYSDMIQVMVALDDGEIIGFSAEDYLMSHRGGRDLTVTVSREEAENTLNSDLTVTNHRLAVIQTDGYYEKLCHEFRIFTDDDVEVLIYVNAQTGVEEKILILETSENGTLVL